MTQPPTGSNPVPMFYTSREFSTLLRISRNTLFVYADKYPTFPQPVHRHKGAHALWRITDIEKYLNITLGKNLHD